MRRVDPSVYTRKYYLTDCTGYKQFKRTKGEDLEPRFDRIVKEIPIKPGMKILDIGCGRGELSFWAVKLGAESFGIDYSPDAIKLAKEALNTKNVETKRKVSFQVMDAKELSFKTNMFDGVLMVEVLEHLYPEEQLKVLREIKRVLKKDGYIFFHTSPSKTFNDFTYRFWCYPISSVVTYLWNWVFKKKYGNLAPYSEIRSDSHKIMHVNEPTYFSLKEMFEVSGFKGKIYTTNVTVLKPVASWKDILFNMLVYLYPLSNYFPLNVLWGNDFIGVMRRK